MKDNIEAERVRHRLTKEGIASKLGISSKTYLSYIRGTTAIPSDVLIKMADMFHCGIDYLLAEEPRNSH